MNTIDTCLASNVNNTSVVRVSIIANGVRLTKTDMQEGSRPFVGASEANNGVTASLRIAMQA